MAVLGTIGAKAVVLLGVALGIGGIALAAPVPASAAPNTQDDSFMTANAQTNLAEISAASIALARSGSETVRSLATTIAADHRTAQAELQTVARAVGFTLPTKPNSFQAKQAMTLKTASAEDFDQTYLQVQIAGHQASISNTKSELTHGSDAQVLAYARTYLPMAEKHLQLVTHALTIERTGPTPVASALSRQPDVSTPAVTTGPLANGAKTKPSSDYGWLIGVAAAIVFAVLVAVMWFRRASMRRRRG